MELAVSPSTPGLSVGELVDLCSFAEEIGYRHAWMSEVAGPDAFVLAAGIASRTKYMQLGVGVVPAYTRTPTALATAAASVSQLLGGRPFSLGIGSSSEVIVSQWHGQAFAHPLTRVGETVGAIRAVLNGDAGYQGSTVTINRFRLATAPAGPIPIYVGALRPLMLRLAGQVADGVCLNLMPPRIVRLQLAEIRKGAEQVGRTLTDEFGVMARLSVLITDDRASGREMLGRQFIGPYMAQPVYNRFLAWMGYEEEAAAIREGWAAKDREAVARATHDRLVDDLALVGDVGHVKQRLDEFAEAGLTVAALMVFTSARNAVEETLRALSP